ncbi:MAG: DEAD/DEAH box helicase family protein [Tidjanibacter sp.]|nr:DEAD/DEAH box helicase family protein [Tidjanibacter sp.]
MAQHISPLQQLYFAWDLTHKKSVSDDSRFTGILSEAKVDLNPHQVEAALFAFKSPLSKGAILGDEVGLGKTIEACIILSEMWAQHKRKILVIVPASLRNQWNIELLEKFYLPSKILLTSNYEAYKSADISPLDKGEEIIVCSYNFAVKYAEDIKRVSWDLVVLDEAHKLRNVYMHGAKMASDIKRTLYPFKKVLLTATPLQNNLKELYGLISIIDGEFFSSVDTFDKQYNAITTRDNSRFGELKGRLQRIIHRTLRCQVQEYVNYTKRSAMVIKYEPTPQEQELYDRVDKYLKRRVIHAINPIALPMLSLIIRKILSSSAYAISFTLGKLIAKLEEYKKDGMPINNIEDVVDDIEFDEDEELYEDNEYSDEYEPYVDYSIDGEIKELVECRKLAQQIKHETKAVQLIEALGVAFDEIEKLGGNRKALIFTESRKTQEYLKFYLEEHGYRDKVVCFNGMNNDFTSKCIYENWLTRYHGTNRISGNKDIDRKQALVDYFSTDAEIMIATEAGAEGINLQFCSLVVNFDMPWNPQRIEQRIGRCHRYGQRHDVVVVNFVNQKNIADNRVYQLLSSKFNLFDGVFGCSDEVIGAIDSGIGFEKKLNRIYQTCRTAEEIEAAFDELQKELEDVIRERLKQTHRSLLENFDDEVVQKLRMRQVDDCNRVNVYNRSLWLLAKSVLQSRISDIDDDTMSFTLISSPSDSISTGRYRLGKDNGCDHQLRLTHPLGEYIIAEARQSDTNSLSIVFDLDGHPIRKSLLEEQRGCSGISYVYKVYTYNEHDSQEDLICCTITEDGTILHDDFAKALLQVSPMHYSPIILEEDEAMQNIMQERLEKLKEDLSERTNEYIILEIDKFESWSEDRIYRLEEEVIALRKEHENIKRQIRKERVAKIKLALKEQETKLFKDLRRKQQELFDRQDDCAKEVDQLTEKLRKSMENKTEVELLFKFKWSIK